MSEDLAWTRTNTYEVDSNDAAEDPEVVYDFVRDAIIPGKARLELFGPWHWGITTGSVKTDLSQELVSLDVRLRNVQESPLIWRVTLQFRDYNWGLMNSTKGANAQKGATPIRQKTADPTTEEQTWVGSYEDVEEEDALDTVGTAVTNSADQPYDVQRIQRTRDAVMITVNTDEINIGLRSLYISQRGAVNNGTWWGYPAGTVRLKGWEYERRHRNYVEPADPAKPMASEGINYYVHNRLLFLINFGDEISAGVFSGWNRRLPDYGTVVKSSGSTPDEIYQGVEFGSDSGSLFPGSNLLLDGSGQLAADQSTVGTANIRTFNHFVARDFTKLPVSSTLPKGVTYDLTP